MKLILLALLAVGPAHTGIWMGAKITYIEVDTSAAAAPKGYMLVTFAVNGKDIPSCASSRPRQVAIDITTDAGKMAAGVAMQALAHGLLVTVTGNNTCSVIPTVETLALIQTTSKH